MTWPRIGWSNPLQNLNNTVQQQQQQQQVNNAPVVANGTDTFAVANGQPPAALSVETGATAQVPLRGGEISFGATARFDAEVQSEGGYTTATATGELEVNLGADFERGRFGFSGEHTEGHRLTFEVRMTDADYQRVTRGEIDPPNPYDPDEMPVGSSVLTRSTDYEGTELSASYNVLKGETGVSQEESLSTLVEKTDEDTVRVTVGPTDAVENRFQVGLDFGVGEVHVGNTTSLESSSMKTVEFDLSTEEGRAAYNLFLTSGELPPREGGPGVSGTTTVERLDASSVSSVGGSLLGFSGSIDFASSNTSIVKTTHPDGSYTVVTDAELHAGAPVHLEQTFNADGTEDTSKQVISIHMVGLGGDSESQWAQVYGVDQSLFDGKMDIKLTLTADEAMALKAKAEGYIANYPSDTGQAWNPEFGTQDDRLIQALADAETPEAVALALINAYGGEEWMGNAFALIHSTQGEMPGTIEAVHR